MCQVWELKRGNHQTTNSPLKSQYVCPSLVQFDFMNDKMFCATSLTTLWKRKRTSLRHENPSPDVNLAARTIQSQSLTQGCLSSVYCAHGMRQGQVCGVFDICVCCWKVALGPVPRKMVKFNPGLSQIWSEVFLSKKMQFELRNTLQSLLRDTVKITPNVIPSNA